jgi:hypothetical protein
MRGSLTHNWIVEQLAKTARYSGLKAATEVYLGCGYADLLLQAGDGDTAQTILVEIELSPARIERDFAKAGFIGADELIIVASNPRERARILAKVQRISHDQKIVFSVLLYPQATTRLIEIGAHLDQTE